MADAGDASSASRKIRAKVFILLAVTAGIVTNSEWRWTSRMKPSSPVQERNTGPWCRSGTVSMFCTISKTVAPDFRVPRYLLSAKLRQLKEG